jgi:hypothetical protein
MLKGGTQSNAYKKEIYLQQLDEASWVGVSGPRRVRSMLAAPQFTEPGYWHRRAEETRAMARRMSNEQNKKMMFKIAAAYEALAVKAAIHSKTRLIDPMI